MKNRFSALLALSILVFVGVGCSWLPAFIGDRGKLDPSFALSPDGKQMALSANDGDLYLVDLDSKKVTRLTETPAYEKRPSFSPDGRSLAYVSEPSGDKFSSRVFRMQIDTREVKQLTSDSGICDNNPHYSRDGLRIVFARASRNNGDPHVRDLWNDYDLYVMNADGSNSKRITNGLYQRELDARFSADGSDLIFNGTYEILKIKADGGDKEPTVIVPSGFDKETGYAISYGSPDVSPDGNSILFMFDRQIRLSDLTTKAVTDLQVKKPGGWGGDQRNAAFTADGKRALLIRSNWSEDNKLDHSLWSVDIDGKNLKEIANDELFANPIEWRPKN